MKTPDKDTYGESLDVVKSYESLSFELAAFADESLLRYEHIDLHDSVKAELPDIVKSICLKTNHALVTALLYSDGRYETRYCFGGSHSNVIFIQPRPRDIAGEALLKSIGWVKS